MRRAKVLRVLAAILVAGGSSAAFATLCYDPGFCPPLTATGKHCIPRFTTNNVVAIGKVVKRNGWIPSGVSCGTIKMPILPLPGTKPCGPNGVGGTC